MDLSTYRSRIGEGATLFFAFFSGFSIAGLYLGLLVMVLAAVADPGFWRWCTRRALFWIAVAWTAYVLLRTQLPTLYAVAPDEGADARDGLISIAGFYGLVLAWWLLDRPRTLRRLLILVPAGLMLGVLIRTEPYMWKRLLFGSHRFFGHMTNNAAGLYSATLLVGCLGLGLPAVRERVAAGLRWKPYAIGLGLLSAATAFLFITSQSRSSWLAALVLAVVAGAIYLPRLRAGGLLPWLRRHPVTAIAAGVLVLAALLATGATVAARLSAEAGNWHALLTLDWDSLEKRSIGIRIGLLRTGLAVIAEAPWLGAGIGTSEAAMRAAQDPLLIPGNEHFHNLYIQIAAMTGLVGLTFFLAVAIHVLRQAAAGLRADDPLTRRLARFVLASSLLFAVASLFQVRYDDPRGLVLVAILTAFALVCGQRGPQRTWSEHVE